jgi:hypothetical protein
MRCSIFLRLPVLIVVSVAATGCVEERLTVMTNESGAPIQVKYAVPTFRVDVGAPPICPLQDMPPMVRPVDDQSPVTEWIVPRDLSLHLERCEATYRLESGYSALVYRNGFCDDYERYADQGAAFRPSLEYLVIETADTVHEWRGWDTAKQFRRVRGGSCFLRIRQA